MTTEIKINDPSKSSPKESCCAPLKYIFCGRSIEKISPKDAPLDKSPAKMHVKGSEILTINPLAKK